MPDTALTEEPLQFGEGGRLSGILTQPGMSSGNVRERPVFIFLNAGFLHRVGPSRLYVRLARELALMGFSSLRVDLAGKGDSLRRPNLTNRQSVAADFEEIKGVLDSHLGGVPFVLAGVCSGADNAIRLTLNERRVVGLVLLDPVCFPNDGFGVRARATFVRWTSPARYIAGFKNRFRALTTKDGWTRNDPLDQRDFPTQEQLRAALKSIREREGRVLSMFTHYAFRGYYNQAGQLGRVIGVEGYHQFCTELFWPQASHTYSLELHRRRIIEEVKTWAANYIHS